MPDYLHECFERHGDVTRARYDEPQKLQEIESLASEIANTGRLTYDDIEKVNRPDLWSGGSFWQWPTRAQFDERCAEHGFDDQSVPVLWDGLQPTIDNLLKVLRHIGPVSVALRFIEPKNYGILSPPVEKILEIGPTHKPRNKYLNYVRDLTTLRDQPERGFKAAAEVDMALWVMQEVIAAKDSRSDWLDDVVPEHDQWIDEFWDDETLRSIRVRNLTKSLFGPKRHKTSIPQMAEALVLPGGDQNLVLLSARVAAVEFELAVGVVARVISRFQYGDLEQRTLSAVVNSLDLRIEIKERWRHAVHLRNAAVHERQISRDEANELLDCMREAIDMADELTRSRV